MRQTGEKWYVDFGQDEDIEFENETEMRKQIGEMGYTVKFPHGKNFIGFAYDKDGEVIGVIGRA